MRLDERRRQHADHRRRQERQQHADDETRRVPLAEHVRRQRPDAAEIDAEQRQNGAELDQDGKRLAEGVVAPAEEVLHQQKVSGRGDGQEFGQALDHAEDRRLDQVDIGREGMHAVLRKGIT